MTDLTSRTAVVSAGGSGIGRATALLLGSRGARVAVLDLNGESATAVAEEITVAGGTATAHQADGGVLADLDRAVTEIGAVTDRVDILFNNIGMPNPHGIEGIDEGTWHKVIDVNLKSNFFLTQKLLPLMRATGRGASVIFTASAAGLTGSYTTPLYSLTKAGLIGLTKSLSVVLAPDHIRVNAVCPGPVRTPMLPGFLSKPAEEADAVAELYSSRVPMGRVAEAEEIAAAVAYLASDAASYVNGVPLPVDGGYVAI